jgi:hypothetical protein
MASGHVRLWFRVEGAASADVLDVPSNNNVAELRKAIYAELKAELEPRGITARLLVLSTADGTTYDDPRALVSTLPLDKELIVTGTFVHGAVCVRGGLWSSQFLRPHLDDPFPSVLVGSAKRTDLLCSCASRVYVALCCAVGSRGPARVDSFVEFCSSVEFCEFSVCRCACVRCLLVRVWLFYCGGRGLCVAPLIAATLILVRCSSLCPCAASQRSAAGSTGAQLCSLVGWCYRWPCV